MNLGEEKTFNSQHPTDLTVLLLPQKRFPAPPGDPDSDGR